MNSNEENKNQESGFDMNSEDQRHQRGDHEHGRHHGHGRHCGPWGGGRRRMWKFPFIIALVLLIKSALVMLLWNNLIPELFSGPELSYVQAIMMTLLAKILIGFGGGGFRGRFGHHHHHGRHGGHGWHQRWMKMSPEERAKMKEALRARCRR